MLEFTSLPARQGDALWIRWGSEEDPHQLLIDMGTEEIGRNIRKRIDALPVGERKFDLLVVTHIDADHIGGVLTCLAESEPLQGFEIDEVWFNGFLHLSGGKVVGRSALEQMGSPQGERLSKWLRDQTWNAAFDGGPVWRVPGSQCPTVTLHDGLKLTVLGPTPERLRNLSETWVDDVRDAIAKGSLDASVVSPGLESLGSSQPPVLIHAGDLLELAEKRISRDPSKANGSSIVLLLEYKGRRMLLAGDAYAEDLVDGIRAISPKARLQLDVFKLPHHGSRNNVHRELVEILDCHRWLISTDGTTFKHPDPEAIARIISFSSSDRPLLSFNEPSTFNGWWKRESWRQRYDYDVEYGTATAGLTIRFDADS